MATSPSRLITASGLGNRSASWLRIGRPTVTSSALTSPSPPDQKVLAIRPRSDARLYAASSAGRADRSPFLANDSASSTVGSPMPSRKRPRAIRTRCLAEAGSTSFSKAANSERFFSTDPPPAAPAMSIKRACTSVTGSGRVDPCAESLAATSPRSPSWPNSFVTSTMGMAKAWAMAAITSFSPRPISTGSKKGTSRPWIR